jgi:hypothetical protein
MHDVVLLEFKPASLAHCNHIIRLLRAPVKGFN